MREGTTVLIEDAEDVEWLHPDDAREIAAALIAAADDADKTPRLMRERVSDLHEATRRGDFGQRAVELNEVWERTPSWRWVRRRRLALEIYRIVQREK